MEYHRLEMQKRHEICREQAGSNVRWKISENAGYASCGFCVAEFRTNFLDLTVGAAGSAKSRLILSTIRENDLYRMSENAVENLLNYLVLPSIDDTLRSKLHLSPKHHLTFDILPDARSKTCMYTIARILDQRQDIQVRRELEDPAKRASVKCLTVTIPAPL